MHDQPSSSSSIKRSLSLAAIIIGTSDVLSRLLGFFRGQLLAYYAGTGPDMDVYSFSFTIPDVLNHLLAGSALSITFIPLFQKLMREQGEQQAWRFFWNLAVCGTVVFIIMIGLTMGYTREIVALAGSNINSPQSPEKFALAIALTRIILPAQLFFFWGALLNGVQYSQNRFLIPALAPLFYNIGIITGGIILFPKIGIAGFSWGVLIGAFVGNVLIQIPGVKKCGLKFEWCMDFTDKNLSRYVLLTLPFIIGLTMTFSNEFLFRVFGSFLPETGALASLDYSYKLMFILVGLFGHSFAAGFYPFLTRLMLEKKFEEIHQLVNSILTKIAAFVMPCSVCMIALAPYIITALFQRGEFDAESTNQTARAFAAYLPATFFCAAILVMNRLFYAAHNTVLPMIVSTASVIVTLPLYWLLGKLFSSSGVAAASSICMILQYSVIYVLWNRYYRNEYWKKFCKNLLIIAGASAVAYVLCRGIVDFIALPQSLGPFWRSIILCVAGFFPSFGVALLILELTKVQSIAALLRVFQTKLRGRSGARSGA
ncbi:MAG: murein biosynthesis integral membrane protein MurJ [Chitinivibrionales bacterium]|nr:murein biosynthesis integral membrane protein MurJ [Chitinivibrionales bacterium]